MHQLKTANRSTSHMHAAAVEDYSRFIDTTKLKADGYYTDAFGKEIKLHYKKMNK